MPLLSNLARVRQERKERWRDEGWWSAFVVVEERCLPEESLSLFLVLFCDCVDISVDILLLLTLVLSVEVVASLSVWLSVR